MKFYLPLRKDRQDPNFKVHLQGYWKFIIKFFPESRLFCEKGITFDFNFPHIFSILPSGSREGIYTSSIEWARQLLFCGLISGLMSYRKCALFTKGEFFRIHHMDPHRLNGPLMHRSLLFGIFPPGKHDFYFVGGGRMSGLILCRDWFCM